MEYKWKKSKGILSVLFLLIGLTLMAIFGGIGLLGASSLELGDVADSFRSDYQDTRRFRREISYDLRAMLEFVLTGKSILLPG